MTFILDDSFLLEIVKYVQLAGTWSNPPLMGRVLPDPWSKWAGLGFIKNNKKKPKRVQVGFRYYANPAQTWPVYIYNIKKKLKNP